MHCCILLSLTLAIVPVSAQSGSSSRELTFQISSSPAWTDTGLILQPGDTVTIAVVPASSTAFENAGKRCDPAGLSTSSANAASLPVPEAVGGQRWPAPPRRNRNQRRCGNRSDGCERLFACPSGVQVKIARNAPRLLGFAIKVWTIPAQVVQIHIAISLA